jgi:hypothetical protein
VHTGFQAQHLSGLIPAFQLDYQESRGIRVFPFLRSAADLAQTQLPIGATIWRAGYPCSDPPSKAVKISRAPARQ